jgi:drug/metabolite transporter (DMT)-like permease
MPDPTAHAAPGRLPDLTLAAVALVWGGTFLATQAALRDGGTFGFLAVRFAVGTLTLLAILGPRLRRLTRAEARAGVIVGVALFAAYALQTAGLRFIPSSRSAFLTAVYVLLVPVLQLVALSTRPTRAAWAGAVVAFAGLTLLTAGDGLDGSFGLGDCLTLGCAAASALHIVLVGRWAAAVDPLRFTAVQLGVVTALAAAGVLVAGEARPAATPTYLAVSVGMGVVATAGALAAVMWAQRTVPPTRVGLILATEPVWAGVVGALAGEPMTAAVIGGAALIVLGVVLSNVPPRKAGAADESRA